MSLFIDLAAALITALLVGLFFVSCRRCGPWRGLGWFFMLLFLFTWAGGAWLGPHGPRVWGVYWMPYVTMALIFVLLIAAAVPPRPPRTRKEALEQAKTEAAGAQVAGMALNTFFWILVILLAAALLTRYLYPGTGAGSVISQWGAQGFPAAILAASPI